MVEQVGVAETVWKVLLDDIFAGDGRDILMDFRAAGKAYEKIPIIRDFLDADGNDILAQQIQRNYDRIKADVIEIIQDEFEEKKDLPGFKELWAEKYGGDNDDDNDKTG